MGAIQKDQGVPGPCVILVAVSLISLTDPCSIIIVLSLISPTKHHPIPPPPNTPPRMSFQGNLWVELANAMNSGKVCLTNNNIDDPLKSHITALPDSSNVWRFYNDYYFTSSAESEPTEIKILGDQALEQIAQINFGISLTGDTQELPGHNLVHSTLDDPA
ncbi:hypothetical protein WISP_41667 [Willisornis vidua]|uniref:Uncharacterized protein n=1 Tax=Willisornis vidua TaxID=1566151 RepID=A0ABQ9DLU6_9PASS|nr:hypothetical protein WISP_41667 [Willisornis vidua]